MEAYRLGYEPESFITLEYDNIENYFEKHISDKIDYEFFEYPMLKEFDNNGHLKESFQYWLIGNKYYKIKT